MACNFKISKPKSPTRRLTFPSQPTWADLISTLQRVYAIPPGTPLILTYQDSEGDPIVASSEEELKSLYEYCDASQGYKVTLEIPDERNISTAAIPGDTASTIPTPDSESEKTDGLSQGFGMATPSPSRSQSYDIPPTSPGPPSYFQAAGSSMSPLENYGAPTSMGRWGPSPLVLVDSSSL